MGFTDASVLPKPGVKLWAWSTSKGPMVVTLVNGLTGKGYRFIDSNSIPVRDIESWAYAVAPGETA